MSEHNCPVGDSCCQGEGETFWLKNPSSLFCSVSPIPHGSLASGERLNALTRFVIYISLIMMISNYKYTKAFLVLSVLFIILIYLTSTKSEREGFASLFDTTNYNVNVEGQYVPNKVYPGSLPNNYSKNLSLPNAQRLKPAADESLIPVYSPNNSTTFGSSDEYLKATSFDFENGQRDVSADIQYFALKNGVNRRAMIAPVIAPRIFDRDEFGKESTKISRINDSNITDLTDDLDAGQTHGMTNNFPHLADPVIYKSRVENAVYNMNRIGDNNGDGQYTAGQFMDRYPTTVDFEANIRHPVSTYSDNPQEMNTVNNMYQNSQMKPNEDVPDNIAKVNKADQIQKKIIEKFDFITLDELDGVKDLSNGKFAEGQSINSTYSKFNRATPPTNNVVNDQLLQQSPTYVYTDDYFKQPERRLYLQDIQPKLYSYSMDQTPINSNLGITYAPQNAPVFLDQVQNNNMNMPLYTRIDPQLIRSDGTKGQIEAQPLRTEYSANYSNYIPAAGSVDFENIYDPRFNSYGDPYRSYSNVNLGQVQYYYSDIDAYRQPNFIQRSNVEFVEFRTPQNQVWPEYNRTASLDDMRPKAVSQYDADDLFHRQDQMEHLMAKMNRESWQLKASPLRKTNNSSIGPF
jgi:hypothetical protein